MNPAYRDSVHVGVLSGLIGYLERGGHSLEAFSRLSGVSVDAPADPDARIRMDVMKRSWKVAVEMTRNPALGLAIGADYSSNSHGVLGHLLAHSPTMGAALRVLCRYFILLSGGELVELRESRREAWVIYATEDPDPVTWPNAVERTFAGMLAFARREVKGAFSLDRAEFDYPEPAHSAAYRTFFGVPCLFGATRSRLVFARALLELPLRHRHSELHSILERAVRSTYRNLADDRKATTARLRNALPGLLDRGLVSVQDAAAALSLSPRTLQRHLLLENTTYLALLDKARYERSMRLMDTPGVAIEEIAFACAFLDSSGFFRAFKRWTEMAPRAYRQSKRRKAASSGGGHRGARERPSIRRPEKVGHKTA